MTETQDRAMLPLTSIMLGRGIPQGVVDDVIEMWASACHGIRFVVPRPNKNVAYKKICRQKV